MFLYHFLYILSVCISILCEEVLISPALSKVWGPGLEPHIFTMPARYFFIKTVDVNNKSVLQDVGAIFNVSFEGFSKSHKQCHIWLNYLNKKDGTYIIRYKLYDTCYNMKINVEYKSEHVDKSPYIIGGPVYSEDCICLTKSISEFLENWKCGEVPKQIVSDLQYFTTINWDQLRSKVINAFNKPHSISLCHYVIKANAIYRNCYGQYVGFKMFMDSILLSLSRKINLPDIEFFVNLGDWPLVHKNIEKFPIFSWCSSTESLDIVMPTYDITESTLENMGRVMVDVLSVQGNVENSWKGRTEKLFWRGRDSNQHRLDLIDISWKYPDLFNVSLTNFFFFRDKQELYGKSEHVSFFSFFDYKYQLGLDGTVAAYRFPYLLAGGSLVFKQESQYYEHFYNELVANTHYIPIKRDLSDLVEKIQWAIQNDNEAHKIAQKGQDFVNEKLLPHNIFCYYAQLLNEFNKKIVSQVNILDGMEKLEQKPNNCDCNIQIKDEL